MAYTVNKTNSLAIPNSYTVQDSILNTQTDLSFVGKGYAGYGEVIAENFLHLLENFSNTTAPTKPIKGQLWFDASEGRLKVYNGSAFNPAGSARYQNTIPAAQTPGDLWVNSDTSQMYFYNGTSNVLVGPPSATGTTNGFTYSTVRDSGDTVQNITNLYNDGNRIAIMSEDGFVPKSAIPGFATITQGITLNSSISGIRFAGTATDSDKLGGFTLDNFLRSDINSTTSGTLGVINDTGFTVGANNDLKLLIDAGGAIVQNISVNKDITFKINNSGIATTVMNIDGATSRIGIGTISPTTKLDVAGTVNATAFTGPLTGDVTGNVTGGLSSFTGLILSGTIVSQLIRPAADVTYDLGTPYMGYNKVYARATSAQYADLAENYETDDNYDVGTVVIVGGSKEVTASSFGKRAIGVISANPAYLMNSAGKGQPVALKGKVKVKVNGFIAKGDELIADNKGVARRIDANFKEKVFAIALENNEDSDTINLIECIVL